MPSLPSVVSKLPNDLRLFLERVKEILNSGELVTKSELVGAGIATTTRRGDLAPADGTPIIPPAPTGVAVTGAMTSIFVEWDEALYRGHAYAEVWRASTNDFGQAVLVGQTPGLIFADAVGASATRYYWVRFVSITDTAGPYNGTAGTLGQTSADPGYLLAQLTGQLGESQLVTGLRSRVNLIDGSDPGIAIPLDLLGGMLAAVRNLRADQSGVQRNVDDAYEKITQVLLQLKKHDDTFRSAGINIDPATGRVTIYAVDQLRGELGSTRSDLEIQLDAVESEIALRATRSYVDQQIASAVLDVQDLAALNNVYARLDQAEINLNALSGSVALKANQTVVDGINTRLTSAEGSVTVLQGSVATKAAQSDLNAIDGRLTTAESTVSAIDGASITQSARDSRYLLRGEDMAGERTLAALLTAHKKGSESLGAVADAKQDLSGRVQTVDDKLVAEAQARLQLATLVANNFAYLETNYYTKTGTDLAISSAVNSLGVAVDANTAAILTEATARAAADGVFATSVQTLTSTVGDHTAAIQTAALTLGGLSAQYTVKIDNNGYVTGYGLASEEVDGVPTSEFAIVADKFTIAPVATDNTAADGSPFFYLTTPTTINGVTVPAGAYMKAAFIHDATITTAKIGDAAIDSAKIADLAVASAKIANAAVTTAKINDAAITSAKIGLAAILTANIADAQITGAKIDTATIETANIANGAITSVKIGDAAITTAKINDAAITTAKIGDASVNTLKIAGQSVTVPVSAFTAGATSPAGQDTLVQVQSCSVTIPAAAGSATVQVNASMQPTVQFVNGGNSNQPYIVVKRNGVEVYRLANAIISGLKYGNIGDLGIIQNLQFSDTIASGTYTYTLHYYTGRLYDVEVSNRLISISGMML